MKSSLLVSTALLTALMTAIGARPSTVQAAPCPQIEAAAFVRSVSFTATINSSDQVTLGIPGCVFVGLLVTRQSNTGTTTTDETFSPNTTFTSGLTNGGIVQPFGANSFCTEPSACGHQFPIYATFHDPCTGTTITSTIHVTVVHCPVVSAAAGCPQIEAAAFVRSTAFNATKTSADQVTLGIPGCVFVGLLVTRQSNTGTTTTDETFSPNTTFTSGLTNGGIVQPFGANSFCTEPSACGHQFPIYATFHDPCTGTTITSTIHVTVTPCPVAPAKAGCPQIETLFSVTGVSNGTVNSADQATLNVGGCVTLRLLITSQSNTGTTTTDVTFSPNTTFTTNPTQGTFTSKNVFCATAADCNKQFPIYAIYHDPCTGTTITSTVHITVTPCTAPS